MVQEEMEILDEEEPTKSPPVFLAVRQTKKGKNGILETTLLHKSDNISPLRREKMNNKDIGDILIQTNTSKRKTPT